MESPFARLAALDCPFVSAVHPAAAIIQEGTYQWATACGLLATPTVQHSFMARQYGILMARAYPNAPEPMLQLIADWNSWLFLLDDVFDQDAAGDVDRIERAIQRVLGVFRGNLPSPMQPMDAAVMDLALRMVQLTEVHWREGLFQELTRSFAASRWEAQNRATRTIPTLTDYWHYRPYGGAVYCYLLWIEPAMQATLPMSVVQHPLVQRLTTLTNDVIWLANDLISFERELAAGDVHNLVYLLHSTNEMSLNDAMQEVITEHNERVTQFLTVREQLTHVGLMEQTVVQQYVSGLQHWIRANYDWSHTTLRYQEERAVGG